MNRVPSLAVERGLWEQGYEAVVGVDEVGSRCVGRAHHGRCHGAAPGIVGCTGYATPRCCGNPKRERLFARLAGWCAAWGVGAASQQECDEVGMAEAQRRAARRAIEQLGFTPDRVLVDGNWDFVGMGSTIRIVKGDVTCLSIATASILAKVTRDRLMRAEADNYPGYEFDANKGYPCPRHKMALHAYGPTAIHRRTWIFMEHLVWGVAGSRAAPRPWLPTDEEAAQEMLFVPEG